MKRSWAWLGANVNQLTSIAAAVGVVVAAVGFGITWYQLAATTAALKAANTYTIQNDGRELLDTLEQRGFVRDLVTGKLTPENEKSAKFDLWKMFNFYLSVYRQSKADGITDEFRTSFIADYCGFVALPAVDTAWKKMVADKSLNEEQAKMRGQWCA
ncbi:MULTISPECIES: hypothetical protein [unclassified Mesorhizobium]|uniref:hypothetical protein n=1 Tax=unclassified Mesorhizobium TaxID=325217 RepID=UPI000FC9B28F|nr:MULTISPECIES: hypothetical protein [unclassified Mesorhizobium]RUV19934.1 hypothetical protein EOB80_17085 [Mesorhizobium sp. M7A.F.Ca.MR.245.00.0.0]RUV37435.1 hypothetical protein EOB49_11795 [Mesorhizobium sp. M7A.F.Ca.MR.148.00.0.0]RUV53812.1 hypothetical protein EOB77_00760 [Mesorhizobium sp. M7A.F.Ca.MR.228.00.0.0]